MGRDLMSDRVMKGLRRRAVIIIPLITAMCLTGCERNNTGYRELNITETEAIPDQEEADVNEQEIFAKGYNLPVSQKDIDQTEKETEELLDLIEDLYQPYLKDETTVPEDVLENMANVLANKGYLVKIDGIYSNIRNEKILEEFLIDAKEGKQGSAVLYELRTRGSVTRYEYSFDGSDMYVFSSGMEIGTDGTRHQTYCSYTRLKTWRYTDAGWFCYELCVPEYPEVTEIVDGSVLIRVKPISEENKLASEKYVLGIGYHQKPTLQYCQGQSSA